MDLGLPGNNNFKSSQDSPGRPKRVREVVVVRCTLFVRIPAKEIY